MSLMKMFDYRWAGVGMVGYRQDIKCGDDLTLHSTVREVESNMQQCRGGVRCGT
jgi:hypothetical protein